MQDLRTANRKLALKLLAVTALMFGFGYAMVPLYDVFCEITGLNGKTGRMSDATAAALGVDESRLVKVEFVTSVDASLPWRFAPMVTSVEVHPGAETQVMFEAANRTDRPIVGQAVPSVSPTAAARHFSKTECFCFTRQELAPGEVKQMPVRFVVNPRLPEHIRTLTLGYTFFEADPSADAAAEPVDLVIGSR